MNGHLESLHYGKSCKTYENKIKSPKSMFFFVFSKVNQWTGLESCLYYSLAPRPYVWHPGLDGEADE